MTHLLKPELDAIKRQIVVSFELAGRSPRKHLAALDRVREALADSEAVTLQALRNVGIDIACGACMCQAFTGSNAHAHTCTEAARPGIAGTIYDPTT